MAAQASNKGGFANNTALQMVLLAIVAVLLIALAAKYVW